MYGIAEFANLSVLAVVTWNFSGFLVLTRSVLIVQISLVSSLLVHFLAKLRHNLFLLDLKVFSPHTLSAFW